MKTLAKIVLSAVSVFYPFGLCFFGEFTGVLLAIMAILWAFRGFSETKGNSNLNSEKSDKFTLASAEQITSEGCGGNPLPRSQGAALPRREKQNSDFKIFAYAMSGFFILCLAARNYGAQYLYPVIINAFLAAIFYFSLRSEAIITRIAKLQEGGELPRSAVCYTRMLTKIWLWFFIINGAASAALACLEDKIYWSFYTGAISYFLVGALFGGEMIFRKFYAKNA